MKYLIQIFVALFAASSLMAQTDLEKDKKIRDVILKDVQEKGIEKDQTIQSALKAAHDAVLFKAWAQFTLAKNPITLTLKERIYKEQSELLGKTEFKIYHVFVTDEKSSKLLIQKMNGASDWTTLDPKNVFGSDVKYSFSRTDWINLSSVLPDFRQAVAEMSKGSFTPSAIKAKDGWHVVGMLDVRPFVMPPFEKIDKELNALAERKILDSRIQFLLSSENKK